MDTNEIMNNDEVINTTEEVVDSNSGKGLLIVAGIGLAVLVGGVAYKYAVKPIVAKIKAKKSQKTIKVMDAEVIDENEEDFESNK